MPSAPLSAAPVLILTPTDFSLSPATATSVVDWVRSTNGQQAAEHGRCAASLLPADDDVVLVLPPRAVSWHRVGLPKVSGNRLRAALDGLLEDRLLSDPAELHFALEPGGRPGQTLWVAACQKPWLRAWLQLLESAGRPANRIVPAIQPVREGEPGASVHWAFAQGGRAWLTSASAQGVATLPLPADGLLAVEDTAADALWLAEPSVTAQAERALDRRLTLMPWPQWLLRCAQDPWNLAQFDLSLSGRARRGQRLRQGLRQFISTPDWRPARWGLVALLLSVVVGLNALAWMERNSLQGKQRAVVSTLQKTFPDVRVVLDAPVQMRRELTRLQQASGTLSTDDLEAMLATLAQVAPDASPRSIDFSPGTARLGAWNVPQERLQAVQQALDPYGWQAVLDAGTLTIQAKAP